MITTYDRPPRQCPLWFDTALCDKGRLRGAAATGLLTTADFSGSESESFGSCSPQAGRQVIFQRSGAHDFNWPISHQGLDPLVKQRANRSLAPTKQITRVACLSRYAQRVRQGLAIVVVVTDGGKHIAAFT